jgi:anti-sigma factor RsiW
MRVVVNPMHAHRERCLETRERMSDYLDGELNREDAAAVEAHARWCPNCRRLLRNLGRTVGALQRLRDVPPPGE